MSTKEIANILNDIEKYAKEKGVKDKIDPQIVEAMQSYKKFFETAEQRSRTMVKNTIRQTDRNTNTPIAMIIGAAHTDLVAELLKKEHADFAIVSPLAMKNNIYDDPTNIPMKAFLRKEKRQSVDENSLGDFLDGERKPPSVIDKPWFIGKTRLYMKTRRLAILSAGGGQPPRKPPTNGYELRGMYNDRYGDDDDIDWESIVIEHGGQVLVAIAVDDEYGNHKKIWAKAKKITPTVGEPSSLEQQLKNDLKDLKEGNPSEIQTKNGIVKKIAPDVIAAFSLNKEKVASINMQAVWQ